MRLFGGKKKKKNETENKRPKISFSLLGIHQSGKSAICRQYLDNGWQAGVDMILWIRMKCITEMVSLVKRNIDETKNYENETLIQHIKHLIHWCDTYTSSKYPEFRGELTDFTSQQLDAIKLSIQFLWHLDQIKGKILDEHQFLGDEGIDYFFNKIELIFSDKYQPTEQDLIRFYRHTPANLPHEYMYKDTKFCMIDTGSSPTEGGEARFEYMQKNAQCIVFVAALNHFGNSKWGVPGCPSFDNWMKASLQYFEDVCNKFDKKIVLILSKADRFKKYLMNRSLRECFDEYPDLSYMDQQAVIMKQYVNMSSFPVDIMELIKEYVHIIQPLFDQCYHTSLNFIKEKYLSLNTDKNRKIDCFVTSIEDNNATQIINTIQDDLIRNKDK